MSRWRDFHGKERDMNIQATGVSLPPQANSLPGPAPRAVKTPGEARSVDAAQLPSPTQQPDRAQLEAATQSVREFVKPINSNLEFSINQDTGQLVVRIIDRATKEVIRQMPSQEMLDIAKALDNIKGLLVRQTA
jgi:flagellar protein FlaG